MMQKNTCALFTELKFKIKITSSEKTKTKTNPHSFVLLLRILWVIRSTLGGCPFLPHLTEVPPSWLFSGFPGTLPPQSPYSLSPLLLVPTMHVFLSLLLVGNPSGGCA